MNSIIIVKKLHHSTTYSIHKTGGVGGLTGTEYQNPADANIMSNGQGHAPWINVNMRSRSGMGVNVSMNQSLPVRYMTLHV
jgi:hypothetical protein